VDNAIAEDGNEEDRTATSRKWMIRRSGARIIVITTIIIVGIDDV